MFYAKHLNYDSKLESDPSGVGSGRGKAEVWMWEVWKNWNEPDIIQSEFLAKEIILNLSRSTEILISNKNSLTNRVNYNDFKYRAFLALTINFL